MKDAGEVKGLRLACPKCGRELFWLSFTGIILAPQTALFVFCGKCQVMISLVVAFPNLLHKATEAELLQTTVPYQIVSSEKEGDKG